MTIIFKKGSPEGDFNEGDDGTGSWELVTGVLVDRGSVCNFRLGTVKDSFSLRF